MSVCWQKALTSLSVLLDNIAGIIELGKCCCQLVQVVTECMRCQIRNASLYDLRKPENQLSKFPLFGTVQLYGGRVDL